MCVSSWATRHSITVLLKHVHSGRLLLVSNVYDPTEEGLKQMFVQELYFLAFIACHPWILARDFNLHRRIMDRSASIRVTRMMEVFNAFIADVGVIDTPIKNRSFTWSDKRPQPRFTKIDRVFTSNNITAAFLVVTLEALEVLVSDHASLMLKCRGLQHRKGHSKMECFWFKYDIPKAMVQRIWSQQVSQFSIQHFHASTTLLVKALKD